jgi:uncharacterized protein YcbK (DUF882 family)
MLNRRSFLGYGAAAAAAAVLPSRAQARTLTAERNLPERTLSFFNTHTAERLNIAYCCGGEYQPEALEQINFILRDFRANEIKPIDPKLLDLLYIISGYRSPATNAMLQARGGEHSGVASSSMHLLGKAIDIRVPGVKLDHLRGAATSLKLGGVGYYPASNFVHVDTGRVRYW